MTFVRRPGVRLILTATLFFALMQVGVKLLHRLPTVEIVFFRAVIAFVICLYFVKRKGLSLLGNHKGYLFLRGLCGSIALLLFFYTLQSIPMATAVTLQYLSPIFTIIFAMFIMRESTRARQWLAFAVALGGVALVKGFDPRVSMFHLGLGVASAMFSGLAYNFIRKLKDYDDPLIVVLYFPMVTIPLILPFVLVSWVWPTAWEWLVLAAIGVSVQVAQMAMTQAYQLEKAADITIFNYTGIIYAILLGYFIFGEALTIPALVGIVVVIAGVYLGNVGVSARIKRPPTGDPNSPRQ
jgi:drug/metabolite transporter (DMT)-like permease